jgi:hypothetical protein
MDAIELNTRKQEIEELFSNYRSAKSKITPDKLTRGKIYEAFILSKVLESLNNKENLFIVLKNDSNYKLKSSPGVINRKYPRFDLYKSEATYLKNPKNVFAEVWTDVEFLTLSYARHISKREPRNGEYHELDILVSSPNLNDGERPTPKQVYLGIECKNTNYKKSYLREILGVRRELSYLKGEQYKTAFDHWPSSITNVYPPSCLQVYCVDGRINNYKEAGILHAIDFIYEMI